MPDYITNLLVSIIVAVIAACVAVYLAFRRFRAEHMWSRKVDEYTSVLEALHFAKESTSDFLTEIQEGRDDPEERKEESRRRWTEARQRIQKALDMGGFLLCPEAVSVLNELLGRIEAARDHENPDDQLGAILDAIRECLDSVSAIAKRDLGADGRWIRLKKAVQIALAKRKVRA